MTEEELKKLKKFIKSLKVEFEDFDLLKVALTHKSFLNEAKNQTVVHNERLEFLGDAVLELIVTRYLFELFPDRPEGELTSFRAAIVRTESLAEEAKRMNYGEYIFMSKGEEATGGRKRPYILANTFEAVLGAMYLDKGFEICKEFTLKNLLYKIDKIVKNRLDIDPKSKLQEIAQEQVKETPTYVLLEEKGPDHDKIFTVAVKVGNIELKSGKGRSKQEAEGNAAKATLKDWEYLSKKLEKTE